MATTRQVRKKATRSIKSIEKAKDSINKKIDRAQSQFDKSMKNAKKSILKLQYMIPASKGRKTRRKK